MSSKNIGSILIGNSTKSFLIKIVGTGIAFITQIVLARLIGVDHYGIYIYVLAWINVLALVAKLGLDTLLVRLISAYNAKKEWPLLKGLIKRSFQLTFSNSIFICAIVGYGLFLTRDSYDSETINSFLVGLLLLPIISLTGLRQGALQAFKEIPKSQIPENVVRPMVFISILVAIMYMFDMKMTATTAIVVNIISAVVAFMLGSYWLIASMPGEIKHIKPKYETVNWLSISLPLLVISGLHMIMGQTDILMLGALLGGEATGTYGAASRIASLVTFGLVAVNSIVAPLIAEYYAKNSMLKLQHMITLSAHGIFAYTVVVSIGIFFLGQWLLSIFGPEFIDGYDPLVVLLCGQIVNSLAGSVGFLMVMTGYHKQASRIIAFGAVTNILLNYILIPFFGIVGAAIATTLSTIIWNVLMLVQVIRLLKINPTVIARYKYIG